MFELLKTISEFGLFFLGLFIGLFVVIGLIGAAISLFVGIGNEVKRNKKADSTKKYDRYIDPYKDNGDNYDV